MRSETFRILANTGLLPDAVSLRVILQETPPIAA